MPILPAEPALFPTDLLSGADLLPPGPEDRLWWVCHTRPRQEKSLARELHRQCVPYYLPLVEHRSLIRGRAMTSQVPLFTSYVFLLAHHEDRVRALATGRVVHSLPVPNQPGLWRDLRQIHQLIASGASIQLENRLEPGTPVEIRSGSLAGLRGTILRTATGRRFVVAVDLIHKGASVMVDDFLLAKCDPEPIPKQRRDL